MAKEYFQDIIPPNASDPQTPKRSIASTPSVPPMQEEDDTEHTDPDMEETVPIHKMEEPAPSRGIRDIAPPRPRMRPSATPIPPGRIPPARTRGGRSHWWMWGVAAILVIAIAGLALFAFRPTTVTVTPRSHLVTFTNADQFTAYPAPTAATGTLTYTVQTEDFTDSEAVTASASTSLAAAKASGSITVYNAYSASSVHLIANTRFSTPDGLIFRIPNAVTVPGKKGSTPGSVEVTVIADQPGEQYNIAPVSRFTIPGLKSTPTMYANVYASSQSAMTGGSSASNGPGVSADVRTKAIADLQASLLSKVQAAASALSTNGSIVLPDLMQVTYAAQPDTAGATGQVMINESAHAVIPVFPSQAFGQSVGSLVSADVGTDAVTIIPGTGFGAQLSDASTPSLGTDPLSFTLTGQAELVWSVDSAALAQALAGKDSGAFQTIVNGFSGIEEAHARIEPFWNNTFPANPSEIQITVEPVSSTTVQ